MIAEDYAKEDDTCSLFITLNCDQFLVNQEKDDIEHDQKNGRKKKRYVFSKECLKKSSRGTVDKNSEPQSYNQFESHEQQ